MCRNIVASPILSWRDFVCLLSFVATKLAARCIIAAGKAFSPNPASAPTSKATEPDLKRSEAQNPPITTLAKPVDAAARHAAEEGVRFPPHSGHPALTK